METPKNTNEQYIKLDNLEIGVKYITDSDIILLGEKFVLEIESGTNFELLTPNAENTKNMPPRPGFKVILKLGKGIKLTVGTYELRSSLIKKAE